MTSLHLIGQTGRETGGEEEEWKEEGRKEKGGGKGRTL